MNIKDKVESSAIDILNMDFEALVDSLSKKADKMKPLKSNFDFSDEEKKDSSLTRTIHNLLGGGKSILKDAQGFSKELRSIKSEGRADSIMDDYGFYRDGEGLKVQDDPLLYEESRDQWKLAKDAASPRALFYANWRRGLRNPNGLFGNLLELRGDSVARKVESKRTQHDPYYTFMKQTQAMSKPNPILRKLGLSFSEFSLDKDFDSSTSKSSDTDNKDNKEEKKSGVDSVLSTVDKLVKGGTKTARGLQSAGKDIGNMMKSNINKEYAARNREYNGAATKEAVEDKENGTTFYRYSGKHADYEANDDPYSLQNRDRGVAKDVRDADVALNTAQDLFDNFDTRYDEDKAKYNSTRNEDTSGFNEYQLAEHDNIIKNYVDTYGAADRSKEEVKKDIENNLNKAKENQQKAMDAFGAYNYNRRRDDIERAQRAKESGSLLARAFAKGAANDNEKGKRNFIRASIADELIRRKEAKNFRNNPSEAMRGNNDTLGKLMKYMGFSEDNKSQDLLDNRAVMEILATNYSYPLKHDDVEDILNMNFVSTSKDDLDFINENSKNFSSSKLPPLDSYLDDIDI